MLRIDDTAYFSKPTTYFMWFLMAFQAGYINVGAFYLSGNFVSHVTGTSSQIGMGISSLDQKIIITFLTVLLAFITGAAFSGHFIGRKMEEKKEPNYILVLSIKALFFFLVLLISSYGHMLPDDLKNIKIIFLLSFCCGIQNSTCALATGGFLKPTHMTGLSTDIGIFLTKVFAWKESEPNKYKEERNKNMTRIGILFSFIAGGVISGLIFGRDGHLAFLFPFLSSLCFLAMGMIRDLKLDNKYIGVHNVFRGSTVIIFIGTLLLSLRDI